VASLGTYPETVSRSRTTAEVDIEAVPEEDTVVDTEVVPEAVRKAEAFVSTSCLR